MTLTRKDKFPHLTKKNTLTVENVHTFHRAAPSSDMGWCYAFKVSQDDGRSPTHPDTLPMFICREDEQLSNANASSDWRKDCAAGVNVAAYDWCLNQYSYGRSLRLLRTENKKKLWLVRFYKHNIACIPRDSDGKIRLTLCTVLREIKSPPVIHSK